MNELLDQILGNVRQSVSQNGGALGTTGDSHGKEGGRETDLSLLLIEHRLKALKKLMGGVVCCRFRFVFGLSFTFVCGGMRARGQRKEVSCRQNSTMRVTGDKLCASMWQHIPLPTEPSCQP